MNSGVDAAAIAALHQPSDLVMRRPGHSACRPNPERSSSALVRLPCGSASRRLALRSSRRVRSMGPTVIPRKKEVLTLAFSGIIPAPRYSAGSAWNSSAIGRIATRERIRFFPSRARTTAPAARTISELDLIQSAMGSSRLARRKLRGMEMRVPMAEPTAIFRIVPEARPLSRSTMA